METMLSKKRADVFSDYLAAVRRKMEADGSIKIYKSELDAIDAEDKTPGGPDDNS